ncbi:MAG: alkaline phosphatase [Phycisphaerales bacterium]
MTNPTPGPDRLTRREFVGASVAAAALFGGPHAAGAQSYKRRVGADSGAPKNVILMISDGMSPGVLQLGEDFSLARRGRSSAWMGLCRDPRATTTMMATASANGPVTDSGAAGTAFSTGRRADNGVLCVLPDGARPTPLVQRLKAAGRATGLVTTTQLAHATPASFVVNHPARHDYAPIAAQMLARRPDVMLGGGTDHFTDALIATHAPDAALLRTRADVLAGLPDDGPVMGFFTPDHMSYELDRTDDEPSLAEMTTAALARLDRDPGGFFLMVEGGRVDHAAHANDILALLHDQLAFDDAVRVAASFVEQRDDTLLIVTSDHANANPGVTHYAEKGAKGFATLAGADGSMSFEAMYRALGHRPTASDIAGLVERERKLSLRDTERLALERAVANEPMHAFRDADKLSSVMGAVLANHYSVAFASPNHTADHVWLSTLGPMSEGVPRVGHITDLHAYMCGALRLA